MAIKPGHSTCVVDYSLYWLETLSHLTTLLARKPNHFTRGLLTRGSEVGLSSYMVAAFDLHPKHRQNAMTKFADKT